MADKVTKDAEALAFGFKVMNRAGRARRIRKKAGLTLDQLGLRSGLPTSSVCDFEHGRYMPKVAALIAWGRALAEIEGERASG